MTTRYRIAFDIGGTFTDLALHDAATGRLATHKVLTTPDDPAAGALRGLDELCLRAGVPLAGVDLLVHGTTLVTNAIIERRGAPTGLVCTRGFRDVLEIGREQRYDIYDLFLRYPEPLVPRRWRLEVDERCSRDGAVLRPLDPAQVRAAARALVAQGVRALAVVFLHAYRNPAHEQAARDLLLAEFPDLAVSISSEVAPEIREYERTCTTVANAYVQPLVAGYLDRLAEATAARGFRGRFYLMQSSGGLLAPDAARRYPIRLLESGPAGGALVAAFFGERAGRPAQVAFDMGGTTAKIALVRGGQPDVRPVVEVARVHRFRRGSGIPITIPVVDMIEIGAGGGSIARVDALGLLKVGPDSAGAVPGPACYGFGGVEATVTDACLALGYFDPHYFLGGAMVLDAAAAEAALARAGAPLGLDPVQTAWGVYSIACENMAAAARVHLIERGEDPRRFALMAFGGAGPAHAAHVARILGMREVVIPPAPGVASAIGFLVAPASVEVARSLPGELDALDWHAVDALLADLEARGRTLLAQAGVAPEGVRVERRAEMRFAGQFHDIAVPLPPGPLADGGAADLQRQFVASYRTLYGHSLDGYRVQALNWRVLVTGSRPEAALVAAWTPTPGEPRKGVRRAYFPERGGFVEVPVFDRYRLPAGAAIAGPAIIEEREATTVVAPGDRLTVDPHGHLLIAVGGHA
ncbi:MAG: hydantoinase/oxoprolinase family protein [Armatimonadota bacterium]|nr:hydantoinase/oxoprolinase family protein [Armatimonadota bacterium]MDR7536948.1 hydantoinase/oxoprolinase family protein [Armatimonadota bacterium]